MLELYVGDANSVIRHFKSQDKNLYIQLIIPVCSKIFYKEKLKKIFGQEINPKNVIVICAGYVNIFKGIFGSVYDIRNWKFLGYKDGFSLNQCSSVLEFNEVDKGSVIKHIKKSIASIFIG